MKKLKTKLLNVCTVFAGSLCVICWARVDTVVLHWCIWYACEASCWLLVVKPNCESLLGHNKLVVTDNTVFI